MLAFEIARLRKARLAVAALMFSLYAGAATSHSALAQIQGRPTGWCTDHNGRNFRCGTRSSLSRGNNRAATAYNNRCADLLNLGQSRKSLDLVARAISQCRRAMAHQSHWIHQRNLFAALTYYWSLRAKRERSCVRKLAYMRRAYSTSHYYPARHRRDYRSQIATVQRNCRSGRSRQSPLTTRHSPSTKGGQQRHVYIGATGAITGNVQMCMNGRCIRLTSGRSVFSNATIRTGPRARVQFLFKDESLATVGPNSEFVLDKFVYDPSTPSSNVIGELTRGIIRYVTNPKPKIRTSESRKRGIRFLHGTIGPRGTEFVVRISRAGEIAEIDLLDGELLLTPRLGGRRLHMKAGLWSFRAVQGKLGEFRVRYVTAYRTASDQALVRRRAHYDQTLPMGRLQRSLVDDKSCSKQNGSLRGCTPLVQRLIGKALKKELGGDAFCKSIRWPKFDASRVQRTMARHRGSFLLAEQDRDQCFVHMVSAAFRRDGKIVRWERVYGCWRAQHHNGRCYINNYRAWYREVSRGNWQLLRNEFLRD